MFDLRGFHSQDLLAILDFLFFGEANVYQENLYSFLVIAEELKLKGLTGQVSSDLAEEQEKCANPKPIHKPKNHSKLHKTEMNKTFMIQKKLQRLLLSATNPVVTSKQWMRR